jgi:hypothetical protein
MPPQMKFWELTSAFRESPAALRQVLGSPRWREPYSIWYEQLDDLIDRQVRDVLDALVPLELSRAVAAKDPTRFLFDPASRHVRRPRAGEAAPPGAVEMSAVDVHDRFGGSVLEEVHERGVAEVGPVA